MISSLIVLYLTGCNGGKKEDKTALKSPVVPIEVKDIDDLMVNPDQYDGQLIRVSGLVTHVCKHSGKRIHLASPESNNWIRVEATGNIKNFQRELEGSNIVVEGEFKKLVIDQEYLVKWEGELEHGEAHFEDGHEADNNPEAERGLLENMRQRLSESETGQIISCWIDGIQYSENQN